MRKIFVLLVFLVTSVFADVKYVDLFDAYDKAQAENKTVMVMLSQQGCSGCEYMEEIVFNNKDVAKSLKDNFVVVHVDVYKDGIPDGLEFFATPTFYFLNADEEVLKRMNGGENAKDFAKTLKAMKAK
jgi:thiol:disulfide interchange protein